MNARAMLVACSLLCSACFTTHDGENGVALRGPHHDDPSESAGQGGGLDDASVDAGRVPAAGNGGLPLSMLDAGAASSAVADTASTGSIDGLQVWVGAARLRSGGGLGCGPYDADRKQERALLLLQVAASGRLEGASLTLGEGPALPEVEDPDAYYPPEPPWDWHGCPMEGLVPGFEYPVYDARLTSAQRLIASIHPADVIKKWCKLQPSYPASPAAAAEWGEYLCRPTDQFQDVTSLNDAIPHPPGESAVAFQPEELCFGGNAPCVCDQDSCTASAYGAFHLDVQLTDSQLSGRFGFMEIKLERQL